MAEVPLRPPALYMHRREMLPTAQTRRKREEAVFVAIICSRTGRNFIAQRHQLVEDLFLFLVFELSNKSRSLVDRMDATWRSPVIY